MKKFTKILVAFSVTAAAVMAQGNIVVTGHDDDYHQQYDGGATSQPGMQIAAFASFVKGHSTKPLLVFDHGGELTGGLTALGIAYTNVDPDTAANITDGMFSTATYSAIAVASDSGCGGCDNDTTGETNIASHTAAIGAFLNAGGGIMAFAGATSTNYYAFIPQTPSSVGGAPSSGYTATTVGTSLGIPAVNGDATHNLFYNPGSGGESTAWQIAEINATTGNGTIMPPAAVTLACVSCTVTGTTLGSGGTPTTPAPSSLLLLGIGLAALAAFYLAGRKFAAR